MRLLQSVALACSLAASYSPAAVAAPKSSQHPRVGELAQLSFVAGSAELPIGHEQTLGEIAAWAKANPEGHVVVEGYADRSGRADANLDLSLRRADAVRRSLVMLGIDSDQVIVAGYGEASTANHGRRVIVWGSRASVPAIEAMIRDRGAKQVRESPLLVRR
jgi:outer membrane protein OmpA-like peptidoglycan-associated protein